MEIVNAKLNTKEFEQYVNDKPFGSIKPTSLVVHHTAIPTLQQWKGETSILGLKRYYESKGWGTAPHIFVAPDGIWLFTDMYNVGIHAGLGNATYIDQWTKKEVKGYRGVLGNGTWRYKLKEYSIGIEVVGNYDHKKWEGGVKQNALAVIDTLYQRLELANDQIFFHRDFSNKSCPGHAITKEWLMQELERYRGNICDDIPDWKNVVGGRTAKEVWLQATKEGLFSQDSKFTDPVTKGELAIVLARYSQIK